MLSWFKRRKDTEEDPSEEEVLPQHTLDEMPLSEILSPVEVRTDVNRPSWLADETEDTPHPQLSAGYLDVDLDKLRADRLKRGDSGQQDSGLGPKRPQTGPLGRGFTRLGDLMLNPLRLVYDNLGTLFVAAMSLLGLGVATWAVMEFVSRYAWNLVG